MKPIATEAVKAEKQTAAPTKRRVSQACDHCHRMRTRCNGLAPCSRCVELEYECQYNREKKRRGKVPRHLQKQREAAAAAVANSPQTPTEPAQHGSGYFDGTCVIAGVDEEAWSREPHYFHSAKSSIHIPTSDWQALPSGSHYTPGHTSFMLDPMLSDSANGYPSHLDIHHNDGLVYANHWSPSMPVTPEYSQVGYPAHGQWTRQSSPHSYCSADTASPQSGISAVSSPISVDAQICKYPVLRPLIPYLSNIMSLVTACELLEFYFESSASVLIDPVSPFILGSVFRKRSFLHQRKHRECSPALLSSMLWVAAQTSEANQLVSPPFARSVVCQKLWKLTIDLLQPPHSAVIDAYGQRIDSDVPLTGTLDDVATYVNLGAVASASNYKQGSLQWWNHAWTLSHDLKLGRELAQTEVAMMNKAESHSDIYGTDVLTAAVVEERNEERRRLWWLLYTLDRHFGLFLNRPLAVHDNGYDNVSQPASDAAWRAGEFYTAC